MAKLKILLVEDSPSLLKLGRAIFETGGYDVLTATDGLEALDVLERNEVVLVITDILMPNLDGYSLCYKIRNDDRLKHIPIIVYSATYTSHSDEELASSIGADMFVRKPATLQFLLNAATELISRPVKERTAVDQQLSDVMRQYSSRLIEKLEQKNLELEQAHIELAKREARFRALVENNYEAITLRDASGNLVYQSPGAERILGYKVDQHGGLSASDLFHPGDLDAVRMRMQAAMQKPGEPMYGIHRVRHKDGHYIWLEGSITNLLGDENVQAVVGNFRDITQRKKDEEKLRIVNRLYAFVSAINQAIVHITSPETLFNKVCDIATSTGEFKLAWLGLIDERTQQLTLVACSTTATEVPVPQAIIPYENDHELAKPLKTGEPNVLNDLATHEDDWWRGLASKYGCNSCILMPIKKEGHTVGLYVLVAEASGFFDHQELTLLMEVVGDISFALGVFARDERRRQMEKDVEHSSTRLKQAQAIAHVGSWELNYDTRIGVWSEEMCRIHGLPVHDNVHTYESAISFVHPDDLDRVLAAAADGYATGKGYSVNYRIVRPDGSIRHVRLQTAHEFDAGGKIVSAYGIVRDETDISEAAQALALSEANLRSIMDLIPQAIFAKDIAGKYLFVNRSFAGLYGTDPENLMNRTTVETMPEENDVAEFVRQDAEVINTGVTKTIPEQAFVDSNGDNRTFYTIKVPYVEPVTNRKAVLGIALDITEQKMAEKERSQMIADMIQRNNDLEQFSFIISHNLRSPIANIMGLAELMTLPGLSKDDEKEIMDGVLTSVKRLDDITVDLNYILQVRQGINERRELVRFSALVSNIKASIANILRIEEVTIDTDFSAINELFTVKSYLHSIFFNLISNSIKYRRQDVKPLIDICSEKENGYLRLIFKDNGLGIDVATRGKEVFRLYKRFHFHVEGKGIGLYMVKTQVEALGGKITVHSEENAGAEFRIEFNIG